jgi:hypothetical protein
MEGDRYEPVQEVSKILRVPDLSAGKFAAGSAVCIPSGAFRRVRRCRPGHCLLSAPGIGSDTHRGMTPQHGI